MIYGSEFAALFPGRNDAISVIYKTIKGISLSAEKDMSEFENELEDHPAIYAGYLAYHNNWKDRL